MGRLFIGLFKSTVPKNTRLMSFNKMRIHLDFRKNTCLYSTPTGLDETMRRTGAIQNLPLHQNFKRGTQKVFREVS